MSPGVRPARLSVRSGGGIATTVTVWEVPVKALVYHGPGQKSWESMPDPSPAEPTDIVVQVDTTTRKTPTPTMPNTDSNIWPVPVV